MDRSSVTYLSYKKSQGIDAYIKQVHEANRLEMVELERRGVPVAFIKDLSKRMDIPTSRMFAILGVPPSTRSRKSARGTVVNGRAGLAAIAMIQLLTLAQEIVQDSTSHQAIGFDAVQWFGRWIDRPQLALEGLRPADYLDTRTGFEIMSQLMGSMRSGAYQ